MKLTSIETFRQMSKKPVLVNIGAKEEDVQAYIRKVSMDEFTDIQGFLRDISTPLTIPDEIKDDAEKREALEAEHVRKNARKFSELMVRVIVDEVGNQVYKMDDVEELSKLLNPRFGRDFIDALMRAQGAEEKELASLEADFQKQPR